MRLIPRLLLIVSCAALSGCCSSRPCSGAAQGTPEATTPEAVPTKWYGDREFVKVMTRNTLESKEQAGTPRGALNSLVLSSGGQFGAYSAGYLAHWAKDAPQGPDKPHFDIVTGVSAGATVAPFAYLGDNVDSQSGKTYFERIEEIYRSIDSDDIFRFKPVSGFLFGNALTSTAPYRGLIEEILNEQVVNDIAEKHRETKSRLIVAATNLDQGVMRYFDLTEIAVSPKYDMNQRLDKMRSAVLASSAIPVFFEPVLIDDVMYADGAVIQGVFLPDIIEAQREVCNERDNETPMRVFLILNDFNGIEPACIKDCIPAIGSRSLELLMAQSMCLAINEIANRDRVHPSDEFYFTCAERTGCPGSEKRGVAEVFDTDFMNCLADQAAQRARTGTGWSTSPPACLTPN